MSLIHVPLALYHQYLQPILKLLFPEDTEVEYDNGASSQPQASWANRHAFLNVSVTPLECSIVCAQTLAKEIFECIPSHQGYSSGFSHPTATISSEDFVVISVEGEGPEAGQRVLDLTSPLAMAGMSVNYHRIFQSTALTLIVRFSILRPTFQITS